jgi:altronate dehydratase
MEPLEGYTFEGYRNPDGSVGTRNILAITTTVQCVSGVVDFAVQRIKAELLPKYPNVDDVVGWSTPTAAAWRSMRRAPTSRSAPCAISR